VFVEKDRGGPAASVDPILAIGCDLAFDYQAVAGDYQYRALHHGHRMQRFWHDGKLTMIERLLQPHVTPGSRLLEIGCGSGNLLVQTSVPGAYPVAVDLAMSSLMFVRSRLQHSIGQRGARRFACVQAIGESLPLSDASIDCVLLSEVIEHLAAPQLAIREAARVLRPGGRLLVTTPNYRSLWPVLEWTVDRLKLAPKMAGEQHISRFQPHSLRRLLIESKLSIEYFGTIYGFSPFLALLSPKWASRWLAAEMNRCSSRAMILVAVAIKS
jgi:SAM-dependent methyltransferase